MARAKGMNLPGSASSETVRRTLKGFVIPEWWEIAAVYAPLCDMATVDPEAEYYEDDGGNGYSKVASGMPVSAGVNQLGVLLTGCSRVAAPP
ncbi:hypothetical protein AB0J28_42720 [Streptosporangium canum]|uniref:hypothetical protein n=1 Tax=Streptosporangium canum TaxID=324952 RepID=UPI00344408B7